MTVTEISDATFENEVLQSGEPVLVDFFTTWCGPCKAMAPALDATAEELRGKVKVVKVDIEVNPHTAAKWNVRGVPTLMLFKNGEPAARHVGALVRKEKLQKWVNDWVDPEAGEVERRVSGFKLANGMDVVVLSDNRAPHVSHMLWYKVGAADVPEGLSGLANLVEHLTFSSLRRSELADTANLKPRVQIADYAFGHDATIFRRQIDKEKLKNAMEVEVDRMTHLRLTDEDVETALALLDERAANLYATAPLFIRLHAQMKTEMNSLLFSAHPYRVPMIGWPDERKKLSRQDAQRFHQRHYAPNNAVLVVAGSVTPEEVRQLAEETYGKVPAKADLPDRSRRPEPPRVAARRVVLKDKDARGHSLRRIYTAPGYATANAGEIEALQLLGCILGGRKSSLLNRKLLGGRGNESAGRVYFHGDLDFGTISVNIEWNDAEIEAIEASLDAILEDVRRNGVTEIDLEDAKKVLTADFVAASDIQEQCATRYAAALALGHTIAEVDAWPEAISKVTADDIKTVANAFLDPRRSVTGWLIPEPVEVAQDAQLAKAV